MSAPQDVAAVVSERLHSLADLINRDPMAAADELDRQGDTLKLLANRLRVLASNQGGHKTPSGVSEQFAINVVRG